MSFLSIILNAISRSSVIKPLPAVNANENNANVQSNSQEYYTDEDWWYQQPDVRVDTDADTDAH